jgi:gamma-glutamyltranspeptidase/glutathione hydrolase
VQVLLNMLLFGKDPQQAADAARFRHLSGARVLIEPPVGDSVRAALGALGHDVDTDGIGSFGGAQIVVKLPKGWAGGSDPRKDGLAIGY